MSNKGGNFERLICKQMGLWWTDGERDDIFWRTSQSGGRATTRSKSGKQTFGQYGDISATDPIGQPLLDACSFELKIGYKKWSYQDSVDKSLKKAAEQTIEKFIKQVNTFGVPVIAEVMILRTAGMAQFLNRHLKSGLVPDWIIKKLARSTDREKASIEIFTDIVSGLKDLCQGVHIITIGAEDKLRRYLDAAKLKRL